MSDQVDQAAPTARPRAGVVDWLFRNRQTGRITVVQLPNWTLAVWMVTAVALRVGDPHGRLRDALTVVGTVALLAWSVDEVLRGVNPFRRILGGLVLAGLLLSLGSR